MIDRLVQLEEERWHKLGYDTVVTTVSKEFATASSVEHLGNESVILTGIRLGKNDVVADSTKVSIISTTDSIEATQRELSQMGTSIHKMFRNYLIVKAKSEYEDIPPFRLDFIKITPIIQTKK